MFQQFLCLPPPILEVHRHHLDDASVGSGPFAPMFLGGRDVF